jgi:hypothetical protein
VAQALAGCWMMLLQHKQVTTADFDPRAAFSRSSFRSLFTENRTSVR